MKKMILAMMLVACGSVVQAQTLNNLFKDSAGSKVIGTSSVIAFSKDTNSGYRVKLDYGNGNTQYLDDSASWNKYNGMVTDCTGHCLVVDNDPAGHVIMVTSANGSYCAGGKSGVTFANKAGAFEFTDGCAYFNKMQGKAK